MIKEKLVDVGAWAQARVDSGEEPPWTFHKLRQLAELATELAEGLDASTVYTPGMEVDGRVKQAEQQPDIADNVVRFERHTPPVSTPPANLPA